MENRDKIFMLLIPLLIRKRVLIRDRGILDILTTCEYNPEYNRKPAACVSIVNFVCTKMMVNCFAVIEPVE